mmetsp:Transcript_39871/g.62390  ORF Transcript_39871/g.62390 Transcript_39871/m.62390 type:complete len:222 (-) Transcript_39871:773-1438(-)
MQLVYTRLVPRICVGNFLVGGSLEGGADVEDLGHGGRRGRGLRQPRRHQLPAVQVHQGDLEAAGAGGPRAVAEGHAVVRPGHQLERRVRLELRLVGLRGVGHHPSGEPVPAHSQLRGRRLAGEGVEIDPQARVHGDVPELVEGGLELVPVNQHVELPHAGERPAAVLQEDLLPVGPGGGVRPELAPLGHHAPAAAAAARPQVHAVHELGAVEGPRCQETAL